MLLRRARYLRIKDTDSSFSLCGILRCKTHHCYKRVLRSVITQELISPLVAMLEKESTYGSRWAGNATGRRTTVQVDCRDGGHHWSIHGHPTPAIGLWRGSP